jgi:hypothetical protein
MPRSIIATTFHALVVSGAHVAARAMAVLRQRQTGVQQNSECKN